MSSGISFQGSSEALPVEEAFTGDDIVSAANTVMNEDYERLLLSKSSSIPTLKIHEWQRPCLTYGYFTDPEKILNPGYFEWGRRPTGGGVLFHTLDLSFSLVIPASDKRLSLNTLENYQLVNSMVKNALEILGFKTDCLKEKTGTSKFCMAEPTQYDLMIEGKKGVGAAQRRTKEGLLHQGSIALFLPGEEEKRALKDPHLFEMMRAKTYPLGIDRKLAASALQEAFLRFVEGRVNVISSHCLND